MITDKLKELAAARAKVADLEKKIAAERAQKLAALPAQFGFGSVNAFLAAVRSASSRHTAGKTTARKAKRGNIQQGKRRSRAKITDKTRAEVKKLVAAGKTGAEIAKATGISLPSVYNIKSALGLIKAAK